VERGRFNTSFARKYDTIGLWVLVYMNEKHMRKSVNILILTVILSYLYKLNWYSILLFVLYFLGNKYWHFGYLTAEKDENGEIIEVSNPQIFSVKDFLTARSDKFQSRILIDLLKKQLKSASNHFRYIYIDWFSY
jgi:hypothetical protein